MSGRGDRPDDPRPEGATDAPSHRSPDRAPDRAPDAADGGAPRPIGRGTGAAPANRFGARGADLDPDAFEPDDLRPGTTVQVDAARSILSRNASPDVGFDVSLNPYRGCEHGCVYCYARPTHETLGLNAGLDFETRLFVKRDAPALLRAALAHRSWRAEPIALSSVTDPYQPLERRERVTRACLEVLAEHRQPVTVVTKNRLVLRDLDLLQELARFGAVSVALSVTTLDDALRASMEPRTSSPARRLDAIRRLSAAGVPAGVFVAPVIPGLTDAETPAILEAAAEAGATFASTVLLRLPRAVEPVFVDWLGTRDPARVRRVIARVREARGGAMNDATFGRRMRGSGAYAEQHRALFRLTRRRLALGSPPTLSGDAFRVPGRARQPRLFGPEG